MFLCLDCDALFEEAEGYIETHGLSSPPYEGMSGCPSCGGSYVETIQCDYCGDWIIGKYVELDDDTIACEDCYRIKDVRDGW
jgi:hypothetical protein